MITIFREVASCCWATSALLCMLSATGCSSSGGGASDAGFVETGAPSDAGFDAGAPSCPSAAPKDGAACAPQGLACEYGSAAVQSCDTVASCSGGRWQVVTPAGGDPTCQVGSSTQCPATFAMVPVGQHCDTYPVSCDYPQGRCACTTRTGPTVTDASAQATWICPSPDTTCPLPRPRVGTACTSKVECDYGTCAIPGATAETCTGGVWTEAPTACP